MPDYKNLDIADSSNYFSNEDSTYQTLLKFIRLRTVVAGLFPPFPHKLVGFSRKDGVTYFMYWNEETGRTFTTTWEKGEK